MRIMPHECPESKLGQGRAFSAIGQGPGSANRPIKRPEVVLNSSPAAILILNNDE